MTHLRQNLLVRITRKWPSSTKALVKNHTNREQIASPIDRHTACLLRRHVGRGTGALTWPGQQAMPRNKVCVLPGRSQAVLPIRSQAPSLVPAY